ncbi:MAG: protein-methionine-sulfoxide reductase heme-binding subunit MsrQ [Pseudomonadota bacterium]
MIISATTFDKRIKPIVALALVAPALWLGWQWWLYFQGQPSALGFEPGEFTHEFTGFSAIRVLLISLAVSPFARLSKFKIIMRARRMVGLFAFFYVMLHLFGYLWLQQGWDVAAIMRDVGKRTYIQVGMAAAIVLVPLAATSTNAMIKRVGGKLWKRIHKGVYVAGVLAVSHQFLVVKGNQPEPYIHGAILALLLLERAHAYAKCAKWYDRAAGWFGLGPNVEEGARRRL